MWWILNPEFPKLSASIQEKAEGPKKRKECKSDKLYLPLMPWTSLSKCISNFFKTMI